jgi:hypothetical protein
VPRRVSLPAADELFRTTGGSAVQPSAPIQQNHSNGEEPPGKEAPGSTRVPAPASEPDSAGTTETTEATAENASEASGDEDRGEHSTAGEGEEPAAKAGGPSALDGGADAPGGAEHTGRERGGQDKQAPAPRRSVPGQGVSQRGQGGQSGQGASEGASRLGGPAAQAGAEARAQPKTNAARAAVEPRSRQGAASSSRRGGRGANRRPSGRERHDEKITVYVSAEELMDLEHARLVLRGEHGLAVDRGRIVREAVAVVLADLESRGEASILVRRLRGR